MHVTIQSFLKVYVLVFGVLYVREISNERGYVLREVRG
jgi:hypothetical protein